MHSLFADILKSPTGIDEITNQYWPNCLPVFAKSPTRFLGIQFHQYRLVIWPIPVGDLANTGKGTFSKIWAGLRSKSGILKTCGILELCLDMGSRIKKNQFGCRSVPLNIVCFSKML